MTERACGTCTACCTTTQVLPFGKAPGVRCPHLSGQDSCGSCSIYPDRPKACQVYRCAWLDGYGPDEARPDLIGLVSELMFKDGYPFLAAVVMVPGRERHNRITRDLISWWRGYGVAVTIGSELIASASRTMTELGCPKCYGPGSDQGSCWNKQNPTMWVCVHCFRAVPMDDVWLPFKVLAAILVGIAVAVCYAGLA